MAPLPGRLQVRNVRCGKPNCRCAQGQLHGPYARRVYWEAGRQRRQYVPLGDVEKTLDALARWREERESLQVEREGIRMMRRLLAGFRRTLRAIGTGGLR